MYFKKQFLKVWEEYKEIIAIFFAVLFLIYVFYLFIYDDVESQKLRILQDKNFYPKVEINTKI